MSDNIIQLNQELIHNELKDLVRNSVEETLNALLDHEADELVNAENTSVPVNVKDIVPDIITGTSYYYIFPKVNHIIIKKYINNTSSLDFIQLFPFLHFIYFLYYDIDK